VTESTLWTDVTCRTLALMSDFSKVSAALYGAIKSGRQAACMMAENYRLHSEKSGRENRAVCGGGVNYRPIQTT